MRILLASSHRYPASAQQGSGFHPKTYPSGSGYHLHDLLARGLIEEGHTVYYALAKGVESPLPPGVEPVAALTSATPLPEIDIIHAPIGAPGFSDSIAALATEHGKPCLLTCHMVEAGRIPKPNWVYVSRAIAQAYGSSRVVLNGLDPDDFIYSEAKQDYLLFIAAMNRAMEKGLDIALALSQKKGIKLKVAGTGLNYETIREVGALCQAAQAEYLGDVRGPRKAELIANAKALLFCSRLTEGTPLVLIEALLSGTPVISSRSGGAIEIVTAETGFLCSSPEEWSSAVDRLGEISPAACRKLAVEKFHYRRMVRDFVTEYQREIARA
jgi:glycosyltransferase involved in cell wall biosynthesis